MRSRVWIILALALASCRGSGQEAVYPVKGKVVYQGKPAEGAIVTFHSLTPRGNAKGPLPLPGGRAHKDGSFRLSTYQSNDGAPAGKFAVTIVYRSPEQKEGDENTGPDLLGARYADPKTTPLQVEIKPGANELDAFELR